MNRLLFTPFFLLFSLTLLGQDVPEAMSYQAVAVSSEGAELIDQNIGIRATILSGSIVGTEEWIEIHNATTDEFGLFVINIGEGIRTGGESDGIHDIDWSTGKFYLRVEMDPTGGINYQLMGTNQLLSVPYALFSEGSNKAIYADSAAHAASADIAVQALNALQSDTALYSHNAFIAYETIGDDDGDPTNELQELSFENGVLSLSGGNELFLDVEDGDSDPENEIQNLIYDGNTLTLTPNGNTVDFSDGAFGAPGASADLPQGIVGKHIVLMGEQYTVPTGKTFYLTAGGPTITIQGYGSSGLHEHSTTPNMPILAGGRIITECYCTGFLVDENPNIVPVIVDLDLQPTYTVEAGKVLFVKSGLANSNTAYMNVNNTLMEFLRPNFTRSTRMLTFPAGTLIKKPDTFVGEMILTGYLIDEPEN